MSVSRPARSGLTILIWIILVTAALSDCVLCAAWDPIANADWAVSAEGAEVSLGAVMLFEKMTVDETDLPEKNRIEISVYRRIRILGRRGYHAAKVTVPRVHMRQEIRRIEGRTLLPDGQIVELSESNIYRETLLDSRTMKVEQTSFEMPGVTDDCIIEYRFAYRISGGWTSRLHLDVVTWTIQKTIPLRFAECRWKLPVRQQFIAESAQHGPLEPDFLAVNTGNTLEVEQKEVGGTTREYGFTLRDVPAFRSEPYAPPIGAAGALIYMFHTEPNYWFSVSSALRDAARAFAKKDRRLETVIGNLGKLETEREKVDAAYRYLQTNISHASPQAKLDDRSENASVDDVLERGHGHQRDINYVFWTLLNQLGIEAMLAYVPDRDQHWFAESGRFWQFQRTLVVVPTGDGFFRFYSPGDACLPQARVPWFNEGATAFVVLPERGYSFVEIPYSTARANETVRLYTLSADHGLWVSGELVQVTSGHAARTIRLVDKQVGEDAGRENLDGMVAELLLYSEAALDTTVDAGTEGSHTASFKVTYRDRLTAVGGRALVRPMRYMSRIGNPFAPGDRHQPVMFDFAERIVETVDLRIPEGWRIEALPENVEFENAAGSCAVSFWGGADRVYAQRLFELQVPVLPAESLPIVYELYERAASLQAISVILLQTKHRSD
jgi:hypothetical protein